MCAMLNIYYQVPISVLTPLKLKIKVSTKQVTKKEQPLNLNLAESSEGKSFAFPVSLS